MQTHKWYFQLLDRETEKVVKQNNKTSAWWHWRRELLSGGVWAGMCLQRKQGKRQVRMALFNVPGPSCAAAISSKQAVLSLPKSITLWEKSVCLWKSMSTNVLNYASVCLQSPISWCSPIMVLTFSFFLSFTFDLVSFLSLCPHFFAASTSFTCYRPLTPPAITWVEETQVGRRNGEVSDTRAWDKRGWAARMKVQRKNKREGSKDMMKVQHEKELWTNRLATNVALTQLMFNSSENWSCSK